LRPTWSDAFATPFGVASLFELRRSRGVSMACAAMTNTFPVARPSLPSQRLKRTAVTFRSAPTSTNTAVLASWSTAPDATARATWTVASYLACTGHTGMQLALPQHGGRSSRVSEFRPCGVERTS